jgi:hypothetical protein
MLRHIFTLTSVFIFDNPDYTWSGVYDALVASDAVLFNTCSSQAISRIIRHCIEASIDIPGIASFVNHIGVWAVEKHLHLIVEFKRAARSWVEAIYRLKAGEKDANQLHVALALADGHLVRSPIIIIVLIQLFFLLRHEGLGWQLELLCRDLPEMFRSARPGEFQVILWSVRIPRSIVPRTGMIVRLYFCL